LLVGLVLPGLAGCSRDKGDPGKPISDIPRVEVTRAEVRTLVRDVGQPSFIEAYEQTAIYAKLPAYIQKWNVDIGDRVKKGQELATLFIPELVQEHEEKKAMVKQDEALVEQARKMEAVAKANLEAAESRVKEARANTGQSQALVARWESEVDRLTALMRDRVVDRQVLAESQRQLQSDRASLAAAEAAVQTALANRIAAKAALEKATVDVDVATARLDVARVGRDRVKALTGYLTLVAPYDGIIILRNANKGDFVLPATGDPSAAPRSADQAATKATPIYVVARTDLMRVYVDVSEYDAGSIVSQVDKEAGDPRPVTEGQVRVFALDDADIPAEVTRSTKALNFKSRTLRAEIDLPNRGERLLPGMYAYGKLRVRRSNVRTVPLGAVVEIGNTFGCYLHVGGKAVWTPVQTGVNDGTWIEVLTRRVDDKWLPFDGSEAIITTNLNELTNGAPVHVVGTESR
jgi:multidrug efflux pump subunit AcrA (membrane-fusion protein)